MGFSFRDRKQLLLDESLGLCTECLWLLKRAGERGKRAGSFFVAPSETLWLAHRIWPPLRRGKRGRAGVTAVKRRVARDNTGSASGKGTLLKD